VRAITREALRVNANRPAGLASAPVLPWVWYLSATRHHISVDLICFRFCRSRYRYISTRTLLLPEDMHTALAVPGEAGASGVLAYEDGTAQVGEPKHAATQAYIDKVLGPTATALYGGRAT